MKSPNILKACGAAVLIATAAAGIAPYRTGAEELRLPDFGSSADLVMSGTEERLLGNAFMQSVRKALPVMGDPLLTDYIQSLGNQLVAADGAGAGNFDFFLIDQPVVNAFAGPDGHIGVFSGLILTSQSESELAAVLAHEIAHVTQRHLMRAFEDQQRLSLPTTALLIAAAILGAQVDAQVGAAALVGVQAAAIQHQINFTRQNEEEADRIGITTLAGAGFDPYAMPGFFQRLAKASRVSESNAPEFLRTHPVNPNRIADGLARAERYGYRQRADNLRFHLARARLREHSYKDPAKAVEHFRANLAARRYGNKDAETYGYALALSRAGQNAQARELARQLLDAHPNQVELIVVDALLAAKTGARDEALSSLRTAVGLRPDNLPLRITYAQVLMDAGRHAQALSTLEDAVRLRSAPAHVYDLMSDAALKAGNKAATHRYRGEKLYIEGDLEPAIRQMELALNTPGLGFHEASKIQVRLDALKYEEKENKEREER
jgi:predicted Zn-dependent protease